MNYKSFLKITFFLVLTIVGGVIISNQLNNKPLPDKPKSVDRKSPLIVKASIPYWDQERAVGRFRENIDSIDVVHVFWYYMDEDGKINTYEYAKEDEELIKFAKENNVKVFATITNLPEEEGTSWDSDRVEEVLDNKLSRQNHIQNINNKLEEMNFDGVLIDYENVDKSQRSKFSDFIEELSRELRKRNKQVAISLHPKNASSKGLGEFQDWEFLAKHADSLNIMAFNEHWDTSAAGPIASIDWILKIIVYTQSLNVDLNKIYLGIPMFGYAWNKDDNTAADGLEFDEISEIIEENDVAFQWDEESMSPFFSYQNDNDEDIEVWFENADSSGSKVAAAESSGFGGISIWRLGGEDPDFWEMLKQVRATN